MGAESELGVAFQPTAEVAGAPRPDGAVGATRSQRSAAWGSEASEGQEPFALPMQLARVAHKTAATEREPSEGQEPLALPFLMEPLHHPCLVWRHAEESIFGLAWVS